MVKKILLIALSAYGLFLCGMFVWMCQPPMVFAGMMKHMPGPMYMAFPFETMWTRARSGVLKVGDSAPDFELPMTAGTERVRLSSFRGSKPVVLVFGSYT